MTLTNPMSEPVDEIDVGEEEISIANDTIEISQPQLEVGQQDLTKNVKKKKKAKNILNSAFKKTLKELGLKKKKGEKYGGEFDVDDDESDEASANGQDDVEKDEEEEEEEVEQLDPVQKALRDKQKKKKSMMSKHFAAAKSNDGALDLSEWNSLSVDWVEVKKKQEEREEHQKAKMMRGQKKQQLQKSEEKKELSDEEEDLDIESEESEEEEEFQQAAFAATQYDEHQEQFERERASMSKKFMSDINRDVETALDDNFRGKYSKRIVDFCVQGGIYCICGNDGRVIIVNTKTNKVKTWTVTSKNTSSILRCFMSPYAKHVLVVTEDSKRGYLHYYINVEMDQDSQPLKLDLIASRERITAVAWQPDWYNQLSEEELAIRTNNTFTMLVGTKPNMHVKKMRLTYDSDEHTVKLEYTKQFDLQRYYIDNNKIIKGTNICDIDGIEMITADSNSLVMVATRIGLSFFYFENISFNVVQTDSNVPLDLKAAIDQTNFAWPTPKSIFPLTSFKLERDSDITSVLSLCRKPFNMEQESIGLPVGWGWSTAAGIITGKFVMDIDEMVNNYNILPYQYPDLGYPQSMAITNFHIHVAYASAYHIIMQPAELGSSMSKYSLLGQVVYNSSKHMRLQMMGEAFIAVRVDDRKLLDTLESDRAIHVCTDSEVVNVYNTQVRDEREGFWKLYLEQALDSKLMSRKSEFFDKSLDLCEIEDENNRYEYKRSVLSAKGDYYFEVGRLMEAAEAYARTKRNFDEVVIKLMDADPDDVQNGLYTYLYLMLKKHKFLKDQHNKGEEIVTKESICLCTWIMELLVHKANLYQNRMKLKINVRVKQDEYAKQIAEKEAAIKNRRKIRDVMREFMFRNKESLARAKALIYHILLSNNYKDDYLFFATLIGDYEIVVQNCITTGVVKNNEIVESNEKAPQRSSTLLTPTGLLQQVEGGNEKLSRSEKIRRDRMISKMMHTTEEDDEQSASKKKSNEYFDKAIKILEDFCHEKKHASIWYTYTPVLINYKPRELLQSFRTYQFLNPWNLIPALLRYDPSLQALPINARRSVQPRFSRQSMLNVSHHDIERVAHQYMEMDDNPVIEYLNWVIDVQKNDDPTIHNLMIYLLAQKRSADRLDQFLKKESENAYFSREFALRVCIPNRKFTSCVILYRDMGLFDNAVDMALYYNNYEDALKIVTDSVEDLDVKKRLAIKIIRYLVRKDTTSTNSIDGRTRAIKLISSDFKDVLRLDDVLEYFPNETSLEPFKDSISAILNQYKVESDMLRMQMREASNDAESIRHDLVSVKPSRDLHYDVKCVCCGLPISSIPPRSVMMSVVMRGQPLFTVFPCGHHFHVHCLKVLYIESLNKHRDAIIENARVQAEKYLRAEAIQAVKKRHRERRAMMSGDEDEEALHAMEEREIESIEIDPYAIDNIIKQYISERDRKKLADMDGTVRDIEAQIASYESAKDALNRMRIQTGTHVIADEVPLENAVHKAIEKLTDMIASECPYDGTMMVDEIKIPLMTTGDHQLMKTWSIHKHNPTTLV